MQRMASDLDGVRQGMAQMQRAGDVGRWDDDYIWGLAIVRIAGLEVPLLLPPVIPAVVGLGVASLCVLLKQSCERTSCNLQEVSRTRIAKVCYTCSSFGQKFMPVQYLPQYPRQTRPGACMANIWIPQIVIVFATAQHQALLNIPAWPLHS